MAKQVRKVRLTPRERTKRRIRKHLAGTDARPRICVCKSSKHTYAQLISDESGITLVSASTQDPEFSAELEALNSSEKGAKKGSKDAKKGSKDAKEGDSQDAKAEVSKSLKSVAAARAVGLLLGKRAAAKSVSQVVFDRNGYRYHGRVKAVGDGARQAGLKF